MRDSIVIIGGGLMGSGIAAVSALAGNPTIIVDVDRDKAKGGVTDALKCVRELCSNGLASDRSARQAEGLLEPEADMGAALEKANMVIEAVSENLELKQMVFKQMDELLPREIPITSNTSGLRISGTDGFYSFLVPWTPDSAGGGSGGGTHGYPGGKTG